MDTTHTHMWGCEGMRVLVTKPLYSLIMVQVKSVAKLLRCGAKEQRATFVSFFKRLWPLITRNCVFKLILASFINCTLGKYIFFLPISIKLNTYLVDKVLQIILLRQANYTLRLFYKITKLL